MIKGDKEKKYIIREPVDNTIKNIIASLLMAGIVGTLIGFAFTITFSIIMLQESDIANSQIFDKLFLFSSIIFTITFAKMFFKVFEEETEDYIEKEVYIREKGLF